MKDLPYLLASAIGTQEGAFNPDPNVIPRRLNNPGNLRFANQANATRDPATGFARFSSWQAGVTALYRDILAKMAVIINNKPMTLRELIAAYAPPYENDTKTYLANVARRVGITDVDAPLWDLLEIDDIP
jgi:hypothetical protein